MTDRLATATIIDRQAHIRLANGPLNLVTRQLLRDLEQAIRTVRDADDVRCCILHAGDARAFCAGSDIKEFAHLRENASEEKILFEDMVLRNLARLPMPTIAAMDAPALGGGLELALACDLRVVRKGVTLGLTESRLGGLAGSGSVRLSRIVGPARAKQIIFTGEVIDAEQALEWGVVNWVCEHSAFEKAVQVADVIVARGPLSNRFGKRLVDLAQDGSIEQALSQATDMQQQIFDSEDLHEGMRSFFEKREPLFAGH